MMYRTHAAFSVLIGLIFIKLFPFNSILDTSLFLCLVIIIGTVPDLDHERSKLSQRYKTTSKILRLVFSHRGFMHSIFPPVIFYVLFEYFGYHVIALSFAVGYFSHLLGDALTTEGINFLNPFLHLKLEGFIHSGTFIETIVMIVIIILDGLMIYGFLSPYIGMII